MFAQKTKQNKKNCIIYVHIFIAWNYIIIVVTYLSQLYRIDSIVVIYFNLNINLIGK